MSRDLADVSSAQITLSVHPRHMNAADVFAEMPLSVHGALMDVFA